MAFNILRLDFGTHLQNHPNSALTASRGSKASGLATPINIDGDPTAAIEFAAEASPEFLLKDKGARKLGAEIVGVMRRGDASQQNSNFARARSMSRPWRFEHEDATLARRWQ